MYKQFFNLRENPFNVNPDPRYLFFTPSAQEALEEIRLLTNLETSSEKLLQIVLSGQPELEEKLRHPQLRQLRQRITLRCRTSQLSLAEACGYVAERLHIAGANGEPIFSTEAIESIYNYARGIPRVINVLCEHALINAYIDQQRPVPAQLIDEVAREFELDRVAPSTPSASSVYPASSWPVEALLHDFAANLHRNGEPASMRVSPEEKQL